MDFFGGVNAQKNALRSGVTCEIHFKHLENLDFYGEVYTEEFVQMTLLVIKLFSLSSKPTLLCSGL